MNPLLTGWLIAFFTEAINSKDFLDPGESWSDMVDPVLEN